MKTPMQIHTALIKKTIETQVFVTAKDSPITLSRTRKMRFGKWMFDFNQGMLEGKVLSAIANLFLDQYKNERHLQIGGLESTALTLVGAIVQHAHEDGKDVSGFFIRKGRDKAGLHRLVEGQVVPGRTIILVDDTINSGKTLIKQVEVLEALGHKVAAVWVLLRFRDLDFYEYFHEKNIAVESLFSLDDFKETLDVENKGAMLPQTSRAHIPFDVKWKFAAPNPSYFYVVPKSDPVINDEHVYFGSDSGVFWALKQDTGETVWSHKTGFHPQRKGIFSSPALYDDAVYFGAYDGNVYALNAQTGKPKWVSFEADWVGSSPAVAPDLGLLFIGLEFGLIKKRGGIAALDLKTGKKMWQHLNSMYTHSSPLYIREHRQVVIGSNDGTVYLFDGKNGKLVWEYNTGKLTEEESYSGFSARDIKESFAYDSKRDYIIFGNYAGTLHIIERKTGVCIATFQAGFAFYSTPLVYGNNVYAASVDKYLYCIDLDSLTEKWRWFGGARIFSSPVEIEGSIFVGGNTGRLTELDPETGEELSFITFPERVTNKTVYNPKTKRFFVPTFANEVYCIERRNDGAAS